MSYKNSSNTTGYTFTLTTDNTTCADVPQSSFFFVNAGAGCISGDGFGYSYARTLTPLPQPISSAKTGYKWVADIHIRHRTFEIHTIQRDHDFIVRFHVNNYVNGYCDITYPCVVPNNNPVPSNAVYRALDTDVTMVGVELNQTGTTPFGVDYNAICYDTSNMTLSTVFSHITAGFVMGKVHYYQVPV